MSWLSILPRCDYPLPCRCLACTGGVSGAGEIAPQDPPDDSLRDCCMDCGMPIEGAFRRDRAMSHATSCPQRRVECGACGGEGLAGAECLGCGGAL